MDQELRRCSIERKELEAFERAEKLKRLELEKNNASGGAFRGQQPISGFHRNQKGKNKDKQSFRGSDTYAYKDDGVPLGQKV